MKSAPFLLALLALPLCALGQSTINSTSAYAYGANVGWINLRGDGANGVRVGETFLSGKAYGANLGWIDCGNGTPANGHTYANTSATDFGVNRADTGLLAGYAYGANVGWINFGWSTNLNDANTPAIDPVTGEFSGYAYAANLGWINLGAGYLKTDSIARTDSDADGMPDAWEKQHFGNLTKAAIGTDADGDGQSDAAEYIADTDPTSAASFLKIVSHTYAGGLTTVALKFTSQPTRLYRIQESVNLTTWTTIATAVGGQTLNPFEADVGTETTKTVAFTGGARHFFRVVAALPLP
ncbi:MAG: hypothetical protein IPL39_25495 [Opitutaceae bacterium]|nr:hypothetical protein [Opitutaceae bacterium]